MWNLKTLFISKNILQTDLVKSKEKHFRKMSTNKLIKNFQLILQNNYLAHMYHFKVFFFFILNSFFQKEIFFFYFLRD